MKKILENDLFWAALIMATLTGINELTQVPIEVIYTVIGIVGGILGKAGLAKWRKRLQMGKEQLEATQKSQTGKK